MHGIKLYYLAKESNIGTLMHLAVVLF